MAKNDLTIEIKVGLIGQIMFQIARFNIASMRIFGIEPNYSRMGRYVEGFVVYRVQCTRRWRFFGHSDK